MNFHETELVSSSSQKKTISNTQRPTTISTSTSSSNSTASVTGGQKRKERDDNLTPPTENNDKLLFEAPSIPMPDTPQPKRFVRKRLFTESFKDVEEPRQEDNMVFANISNLLVRNLSSFVALRERMALEIYVDLLEIVNSQVLLWGDKSKTLFLKNFMVIEIDLELIKSHLKDSFGVEISSKELETITKSLLSISIFPRFFPEDKGFTCKVTELLEQSKYDSFNAEIRYLEPASFYDNLNAVFESINLANAKHRALYELDFNSCTLPPTPTQSTLPTATSFQNQSSINAPTAVFTPMTPPPVCKK